MWPYARWTPNGETLSRIWSLRDVTPLNFGDERSYNECFRELLDTAVMSSCKGRTWAELSGGLDSSSIVCIACEAGADEFGVVSFVFSRSRTADESEWMRAVTEKYRLEWKRIDEDEYLPFSQLPDRFIALPMRVNIIWPRYLQYDATLKEAGVNVVLSGHGGDQVLGGDIVYPAYLADRPHV